VSLALLFGGIVGSLVHQFILLTALSMIPTKENSKSYLGIAGNVERKNSATIATAFLCPTSVLHVHRWGVFTFPLRHYVLVNGVIVSLNPITDSAGARMTRQHAYTAPNRATVTQRCPRLHHVDQIPSS
jgi:hypothetical protein